MTNDLAEPEARRQLLAEIIANRPRAHRILFSRRHTLGTCPAQVEFINRFHSPIPRTVDEAFRGFAKSTMSEEGAIIKAGIREFSYCIILGNTYAMAAKRLASIKREVDQNKALNIVFDDLKGPVWNEGQIQLSNGVVIQAFGARQSIRGAKEETRPDFVIIDDLEDPDWVRTPDAIRENAIWFAADFLPALADPLRTPIRMLGTPLSENCLLRQLALSPEWSRKQYPVKYLNEKGEWQATWPQKHPLEDIDRIENSFRSLNRHREFMQEYMLESESQEELVFKPEHFKYTSKVPVWQPLYAMIDPARTVKQTSAFTGWAVWSWAPGGRLDVWECGGDLLMPDQVIDLAFRLNEQWNPVEIGFEEDGLNEWALQPIRHAQATRGALPLRPMKAPRGKIDFIRGLQTYFGHGAASINCTANSFAVAAAQFLGFPRGRIDAPNALAFCQLMRPGEPVYPDFSAECIFDDPDPLVRYAPCYLAANADGARTTAALVQEHQGVIRVLADWVADGQPLDALEGIVREASRFAGQRLVPVLGPAHYQTYRNHGLAQAFNHLPLPTTPGMEPARGRHAIKDALQRRVRGCPAFQVASQARWTLRAMTAGYAYESLKGNVLAAHPRDGLYKCLAEGIESFAASLSFLGEDTSVGNWKETADGRVYRSALKNR